MYKQKRSGWAEYTDFIILELLSINISFILAYLFRHGFREPLYRYNEYLLLMLVISFIDVFSACLFGSFDDVFKRSLLREFAMSFRHVAIVFAILTLCLFTVQESAVYSRIILFSTFAIDLILGFLFRVLYKNSRLSKKKHERTLLIVTVSDKIIDILNAVKADENLGITIAGIAITDKNYNGCTFDEIPVVATSGEITEYIKKSWVDEVLIVLQDCDVKSILIKNLTEMGVTIHISINRVEGVAENKQIIESIGDLSVVTSSLKYISAGRLMVKRFGDIVISVIGCLFTIIVAFLLAPFILIKSPGHLIFVQERIGRNGKKFKMYKFRSMVKDAETQKTELMNQNTISDNMMFKLDWDPRIIGNKVLPNGRKKTGIGEFIRRTSIDELPQFFNVLKGDMSLVGTRPPTVDEWEKYQLHHRARLAMKPGITGLWQVSGRSDITDFEDVVNLDVKYIYNWSIGLDIRILFRTIGVVLRRRGAK